MGTGVFPGIKRPGRRFDHSPASSAEVKERVQLYLYSPLWTFVARSMVTFTFTLRAVNIKQVLIACDVTDCGLRPLLYSEDG